jgi:hypothetical protein
MVLKPNLLPEKTPIVAVCSLSLVGRSHSLRCDAKQAERRFAEFERFMSSVSCFQLGDFLPGPFFKGVQPRYIESLEPEGVPVISTICIQQLKIRTELCRFITAEDYESIEADKKPRKGDVLVTLDGGTSIGKPSLFNLEDEYSIDSHIAILRPTGLNPEVLVYMLASPLGQIQFQRAESGASGQTGVTEEDVRRFRFPVMDSEAMSRIFGRFDSELTEIDEGRATLRAREEEVWQGLSDELLTAARPRTE